MKSPRAWVLVLVAAAGVTLVVERLMREEPEPPAWPASWQPRVVQGVVLREGNPVPGAEVTIHGPNTTLHRVKTGTTGRFEAPWGEFVAVAFGDFGAAAAATPGLMEFRLVSIVEGHGRVVDVSGEPVAGAHLVVATAHTWQLDQRVVSAADGSFRVAVLLKGMPVDLLIHREGLLAYVERRFKGGEFMTVRAFPGRPASVAVKDPFGEAVRGPISLELPTSLRRAKPKVTTDAEGRLVWVRASGYLPAQVEIAPHRPSEVILWPERVVELRVLDSVRKRGVTRLGIEVEIRPTKGTWRAGIVGAAVRHFPLLPTRRGGAYRVRLPACPVVLRLTAPGYADAELTLGPQAAIKNVWMRPLQRALGGTVTLKGPRELPMLIADATGRWRRVVHGDSSVEVPAGTIIQVASVGARAGVWLPRLDLKPLRRGEQRTVTLHTLPASRLELEVTPAVDGKVVLTDVSLDQLKRPLRVPLRAGRAEAWVRPKREVRIEVTAKGGNYFPVAFEIEAKSSDFRWPVQLRAAAGVRYRVVDRGNNVVPFALARLWEPGRSGALELRPDPVVSAGGADGVIEYVGLRGGDAAFEVRARGFRTRLFSLLRLTEGKTLASGDLVLEPAGRMAGRLLDYERKPVAGAWMRVLEPRVLRLALPGGGDRDVYDLVSDRNGSAATGADGRFEVSDDAPRAPLLACYPSARPDLVATVLPDASSEYRLTGAAYIELDVPSSLVGVYQLLDNGRAVLLAIDPPMSLRPLPVTIPAGKLSLFMRLRNRRWAAAELDLRRGEKRRLSPTWHDPVR